MQAPAARRRRRARRWLRGGSARLTPPLGKVAPVTSLHRPKVAEQTPVRRFEGVRPLAQLLRAQLDVTSGEQYERGLDLHGLARGKPRFEAAEVLALARALHGRRIERAGAEGCGSPLARVYTAGCGAAARPRLHPRALS